MRTDAVSFLTLQATLLNLYRAKGVVSLDGNALPLHAHCSNAIGCWRGCERRIPSGAQSQLSLPWIGPRYCQARLLAIGENLYEAGGLHKLEELVRAARQELSEVTRMRVRFGSQWKTYRGSLVWHHVGAYAATILRSRGVEPFASMSWKPGEGVPRTATIAAYDFIAYTNHVKCSPNGDFSRPSQVMWDTCGRHFLRNELEILEPDMVLVLGSANNGWRVREQALGYESRLRCVGRHVRQDKLWHDGRAIEMVTVPHPSARRVNWRSVCSELEQGC